MFASPGRLLAFPEKNKAWTSPGSPGQAGGPRALQPTASREGEDESKEVMARVFLSNGVSCHAGSHCVARVVGAVPRPPTPDVCVLGTGTTWRQGVCPRDGAKAVSLAESQWQLRHCLQLDPGGLKSAQIRRNPQNAVQRIKYCRIS